ncbi:hypothetical protein DFH29DRAFT_1017075 [Suillus ampliporus]|nr:hypothetical protein DFH29DRAFT_1017075 [Suillus ampliporus]
MAALSYPRERNQRPFSFLVYDALPNPEDDFGLIISDAKSTAGTGTDFYDRSLTSRRYALVGIACSTIVSCCFITAGIATMAYHKDVNETAQMTISSNLSKEMLALMLNLMITLCTESIGFVHGISLRYGLASESRLRFNSNLRLLTATRRWSNPNGFLLNGISVALLLQAVIALSGMRAVKILTWSSSPFDLTAALIHHTQLTSVPFRCMRGVSELDAEGGLARPSETQPSAWRAHPSIRKVIISLWGLVVAYAGYAVLIMYISDKLDGGIQPITESWSFFPNDQPNGVAYSLPFWGWWRILLFLNLALVQGPITLGLHCSELIANPALHWMFGLSFTLSGVTSPETVEEVGIYILPAQPAAYGHLQTLANLVDEWSPVMWWGHKEDGVPYCHAGTSDHSLPDVKMDCVYAGPGVGSHLSISSGGLVDGQATAIPARLAMN